MRESAHTGHLQLVLGKQANLLLEQIINCPNTRYVLIPNQHIGVYRVGFAAEWISREWLARHNGHIKMDKLEPARCPLLGYALKEMVIEGQPSVPSTCVQRHRIVWVRKVMMQVQRF